MSSKGKFSVRATKKTKLNDFTAKPRKVMSSGTHSRDEEKSESEPSIDSEEESESGGSEDNQDSSEEELDDELDINGVSSEEDEEEQEEGEEEEEEEGDDFPRKKKSSKSKHDDGSEAFSSALTNILSSHLKAYDRKDPIMARNKKVLKKNDADKLEQKAKKALLTEKKKLLDKTRRKDILPVVSADIGSEEIKDILWRERKLRKIAQKGVVKLFNAILSTQVKTEKEVSESLSDVKNRTEKKQLITEISKEKFFDLVKAAGDR